MQLSDESDRAFIEVALAGRADYLATGNRRHFPVEAGIAVVSCRELVQILVVHG